MNLNISKLLNYINISINIRISFVQQEWCNLYENYTNKAQDVQDENDSATIDKDCTDTKNRKILHGPSPLQKKSIDEFSVYSTSSPRSVLSHSNRQRQIRVPPSTGGLHPEVMPHNMQPLINDPGSKVQSHNADFSNSQVIIQVENLKKNSILRKKILTVTYQMLKQLGSYNGHPMQSPLPCMLYSIQIPIKNSFASMHVNMPVFSRLSPPKNVSIFTCKLFPSL